MKTLILKLILPLTTISFFIFTKWWYVLPIDAPDILLAGFPLPYMGDALHTSLACQFFVLEMFFDWLFYFGTWFIVIFGINRFLRKITIHKASVVVLFGTTALSMIFPILVICNPDNVFHLKRDFDMEVMETGYRFIWQYTARPDYYKYHPEMKKQ